LPMHLIVAAFAELTTITFNEKNDAAIKQVESVIAKKVFLIYLSY